MLVIGPSGSGKSTTAREISTRLGVPHVELDALHHLAGWTPNPRFAQDVDAATAGPAWVVDGNYTATRDLVWARADTLVWLDLPRTLTVRRVAVRTARRMARREVLWNGNRERVRGLLAPDHPLWWTWITTPGRRVVTEQRLADPRWAHLVVVRVRTPAEVTAWLASTPA